jgi:NAD(P)H-dependent FMN reductase
MRFPYLERMKTPRILAFGGSLRAASFNQSLAAIAAEGAREAGAEVTLIALRDFRMPIFDEDLEAAEGMPEAAKRLKALFLESDGLIISTPEYNSTIPAALKNAIDWVSRATAPDENPLSALRGKSAAIMAASPGGYGGARALAQFRPFLENIGISVLEDQVTIPKAHEAIGTDGRLSDPAQEAAVQALGAKLVAKLA